MAPTITTAEQLLRAQDIGRCELVRGELQLLPWLGMEHGRVAARVATAIAGHVKREHLGAGLAGGTGFVLARNPDTVRAADVAFVRAERFVRTDGYLEGAPDLAVEVLSPDDPQEDVRERVAEWLEAGAVAVWVVDPRAHSVTVHESRAEPLVLGEANTLRGGRVLPGFELGVAEIFA